MIKEYRLSIFAICVFAVIIIFGIKGAAKQNVNLEEPTSFLPLPLKDTPEQILHRKGYVSSYNKETRIPNWVAWHLTAAHTKGPHKRPGGAWHEDTEVPQPRANYYDWFL